MRHERRRTCVKPSGVPMLKPRKQERPKAYYEARELIAECFGLSDDRDPEPASPEEEFRALFRAAVDRTED
jgi:hypothetical protein